MARKAILLIEIIIIATFWIGIQTGTILTHTHLTEKKSIYIQLICLKTITNIEWMTHDYRIYVRPNDISKIENFLIDMTRIETHMTDVHNQENPEFHVMQDILHTLRMFKGKFTSSSNVIRP